MEPRFLFDGAGAATAAKTAADGAPPLTTAEAQAAVAALAAAVPQAVEARPADPARSDGKKEVAFVDTSLADYQSLVDSLRSGVEVELIGGGEAGLAQMAQWALTHSGYDAIHLISHGGEGEIRVGTDVLTTETLAETATQAQLTAISAALTPDGDVLVYGCDTGRGTDGQTLIQGIARDTGADVAASTDPTGAAALGGDWVLETSTGTIDASALDFPDYNDTLGLSFETAVTYTTGTHPRTVVVADLNNDGKRDLAVAGEDNFGVSVLLGKGDGTFESKTDYAVNYSTYGLIVSDLNSDNKLDLVTTDSGIGVVSVLLGNGDGTFQSKVNYSVGNVPRSVAIGDLNGDGKLDLAVANQADHSVSVLLGNGDGTFQSKVNYSTGTNPFWITIQDFNGDTKRDIAVVNQGSASISVLLGNGDGTFQNKVDYTTGNGPVGAAVGDVNGDNMLDFVVAAPSGGVSVLLGNGDGTFQARTNYAAGIAPWSVTLGDYDIDGRIDIAVSNHASNSVSMLRGNGDGTFEAPTDYAVGTSPDFITAGDLNGDGKPDLVTANLDSGNVSVLLNNSFASVTSISRPTGVLAPTKADTVIFDVTFSAVVTGVSTSNFSLSGSGVTGTISSVSGSGTTWAVTVTGVSGDGTLGLDLSTVTGIVDASNGALAGTHTSDETYTVDQTRPTVTSIVRQTPNAGVTNADTLVFRVTFSEAISDIDASDFTVSGTTATVTGMGWAGGNTYDVTISGGDLADANGTVTLAFSGSQNIADSIGNALTATTPTGTDHSSYTLDNTAPAVSTIVRQTAAGRAAAVVYRVTFSEVPAAAPSIGDFAVFGTTGTVTDVASAGGNAYDVTISGGDLATVDGTVTLAFSRSQTIADAAGNRLAPTYRPLSVWSFVGADGASTGMVLDQSMVIAPDGTPYLAYSDVANGGKATVMSFDGTNWVAVGGAASAAAATRETLAIASDGTVYLAYTDTDKKVTVLKFNGTSWDPVGAPMDGNPLDSEPSLAIAPDDTLYLTYTDSAAKAVVMTFNGTGWVNVGVSVTPPTAAPMGKSFFIASDGTPYLAYSDLANTWAVTLRKFDGTDWATVGSIGASGQVLTTSVVVASNGTPYVAYVDGTNGNIVAVKRYNGISWETITDGLPSEVVMNTLSLAIAPDDTLYLTYNTPVAPSQERVMAFNGTAWTSIGSAEHTVLVVPPPRLAVAADGTLYFAYMNMVGSKATVSSLPSGVSLSAINRIGDASTKGAGGLDFTVTFSQGVDGVTADDFAVLKGDGVTGTPTITITAGTDGSSTYTVHVAGLAGNGAVELEFTGIGTGIVAHGTTKPVPTAATSSQAYTLDNAGPTIASIERQTPSGAYTRADSVTYRVTFNEAVSNLDASDFAVTGTTGTVTTVTSAGGNAYDVTVSGGDMADLNGTITLGLAGGQNITDALGNALTVTTVSGTDHSTYTIDNTAPTLVSIVRRTAPGPTSSVVFRVTFDGPMAATAATSDFMVTGTTGTVTNVTAAGDNAYDVTISGGDLANVSGTLTLGFARGQTITDAAGNPLNPTFSSSYWGLFGPGNFTSQFSYGASMTIDNQGTTYVAFNDGLNSGKATVMTFDGTNWVTVGDAGISAGSADFISMATDGQTGALYLAFRDNGNDGKATVMRFNGTSWETVGIPGFSTGEIAYSSLVISASGTPYLAFQNSNYVSTGDGKTTVMKFNGATWETVGNASFTAGSATHGSLFVDYYDTPYFAFSDGSNGGKATVMTLSGTGGEAQWVAVGDPGFSAGAAQYLSLTFDGLNYFLAYQDSGNDGKATVMKFNGASWDAVGTPGFTAGAATYVSLSIDYQSPDRTLYVGFRDDANGGKATVMSYNGTSWETVGNAGFSATDATFVSFGVYGGIPYLAYAANDETMRTGSVMRLTPGVTLSSIERASGEKTNGVAGLSYTVTFSGPVDGVTADDFTVIKGDGVTGTPTITISTGTDGSSRYDVTVTGLSGEGPVALNFSGHGTGVVVHGGTAPVPDSGSAGAAYALDTVAPTVTEVTASTSNGTYKAGDTVSIQVTFSEAVTVTGSPRLTLNAATGGRVVNYTSGSGTTTLTFTYTVQAGDLSSDLDFASTTALALNGGSIKDGTGNNATLTLPTPGEAHSLGDNKNIVIDAAAPTASVTRADLSAPTGSSATFTVTYDGTGTGIDGTTIAAGNVTVTGPGSAVLTVTGASWDATTKTATYTFTPPGGGWDEGDVGTYTIGIVGNAVKDTAGNAVAAASSAKTFHVVYGPIVTDPHISIGGATGNGGVFKIGDTVTATWDDSAAGDNNSRTITGVTFDFSQFGGGAVVAGTSDGQGHWTARYTIVSGSINAVANRNVAVTATDSESLSATTADGTNATVDNSAPAAPPVPALSAASDSGTSNTDAITSVTTPTITGTAEADSTVRVYEGATLLATTTADGEGGWSVATSALGAGSHTITAIVTDAAGNTGTVSAGQTIVIDTAAPTASVTRSDLIAPTGSSATVTVTYDGTGTEIDAASISAGNVTVTGPGSAVLTVTGASWDATTKTATYTFTPPGGGWDEGDVGTYTIGIVGNAVKDTAGNTVAAASSAKTFHVVYGPIVTDPHISISGATGNGGVFKIGDTVTATWDDSAAGDNNSRTITGAVFDFSQFGGGPVAGTSDGQGHWTARYTIVPGSINAVANRNVTVTATSIDRLSAATADGTNATVDNSAPAAPPVPALHRASDSGWSNADAITSATTPTITGTAEANSTVRVYEGATLLATTTADSAGVWSVATSALGAGSHTITVTATDAAGNTGTVSAGQTIIVETIAPVSITGTLVVPNGSGAGTDIGRISASDPGGQALRYHLTDDANGRFSIDQDTGVVRLKQALDHGYSAAGLYPITVQVTDAAGLASTATLAVSVTLSSPPPVTAPTPLPVNAPVPQPPPPLTTPTISVGTVGATDTGGGVGGRLITTDAMSSSGSDTGAGNGGDRLITASNMNGAAGQSMISTASGSQPGNAGGQSGGSGFSAGLPGNGFSAGLPGGGFGSGFGPGGGGFGSSLSSGVFGSSLIGGTTETGPARTLPPATGERQGQGPQDGRDTAGEPSPTPAAPDANTPDANPPDSPAPDNARTGEAPQPSLPPQPARPQAALPGPAARSFTDQLAEAAGRFEHERATLIAAARSAAGLIGRDAA